MQSNLELLAGQSAAASELTVAAMEQAGIAPGEPVMLAGHSQGGMTAMALAGSVAVTSRFAITHVLTAGSPVAGMSAQPGVEVLHVEHTTDVIPALDGRPNPDTRDRTTVRRDLSVSDDPAERAARLSFVDAHDVDLYVRTLDLVDASAGHDASINAWQESVGSAVFGPDGTTAVVTRYAGIGGVEVATLSPASR
jgi:pimeloyl-ACP methyl ester carboxylesterase